jgi:hypothetical protein
MGSVFQWILSAILVFIIILPLSALGQAVNMNFPVQHSVTVRAEGASSIRRGFHTLPVPRPSAGVDFIVPEVCTDENGLQTPIDPLSPDCRGRRKLRIGEPLLTYRTDFAWNQAYMNTLNIPHLKGRSLRVINSRDWGLNSSSAKEHRRFFDFDLYTGGDGYDVIEADGQYVSLIGTADPVTNRMGENAQAFVVPEFFWLNQNCQPEDGWVAFRSDLALNQTEHIVASLKGGSVSECPKLGTSKSSTIYHRYPLQTLSSGKSTESLASWHYAGEIRWLSPTSTAPLWHYEYFLFTQAYGLTRWERWETLPGCRTMVEFHNKWLPPGATPLNPDVECNPDRIQDLSNKSKNCNGPLKANMFYQDFYRYDCRDWSYVRSFDRAQHPYFVPISHSFITSRNLLTQTDFAEGRMESWKKYDGILTGQTTTTLPVIGNQKGSESYHLEVACTNCLGNSIYQDVDPRSVVAEYGTGSLQLQAGARLGGNVSGKLTIVLFLFDSRGNVVASPRANVNLRSTQDDVIAFNIPWDFSAVPISRIRYQIYIDSPGVYRVDDTFLAILPQK